MKPRDNSCDVQASGTIELYFYDELESHERTAFDHHRRACVACRLALEELAVIGDALRSRPVIEAPPSGDWTGFMARIDDVIAREERAPDVPVVASFARGDERHRARSSFVPLLAMAALLALVTMSVLFVSRSRAVLPSERAQTAQATATAAAGDTAPGDTGTLSAVSQQHLERSKLVLLGLAAKDAEDAAGFDWTYERELASKLLTDTRLYRMAAEDRGLDTLAGVMRDLELVLLQTSMTEGEDPAALSQIQRAIRKRDLLQKMDVVRTSRGT